MQVMAAAVFSCAGSLSSGEDVNGESGPRRIVLSDRKGSGQVEQLERVAKAIRDYDGEEAAEAAAEALAAGATPAQALAAVSAVMKEIGDQFGCGALWLPDLVGAAETARLALTVIEEQIVETGKEPERMGTVVLGTVLGDLHDIGKSMVGALLTAAGFRVIDLGTNVSSGTFVETAIEYDAQIVAMSALLTTTAPEQARVIDALNEAGMRNRVKIIVGGGAITPEFAQDIGADGYRATAPESVELALELLGRE
jgi:methylmalonyl-CoA mutase cobalamin-binding domain/chain